MPPTPSAPVSRPTHRPSVTIPATPVEPSAPITPKLDSEKGLYLVGYQDGIVDGSAYITREQIATILFRLLTADSLKEYKTKSIPFSDVADNEAIATLAKAGIVVGYDGRYHPEAYLTMGDLCTLLSRFSDLKSGASSYRNIDHHWAKEYVNICVAEGWLADGENIDLYSPINFDTALSLIRNLL